MIYSFSAAPRKYAVAPLACGSDVHLTRPSREHLQASYSVSPPDTIVSTEFCVQPPSILVVRNHSRLYEPLRECCDISYLLKRDSSVLM